MRTCPFPACSKTIDANLFACPKHWASMTEPERTQIWKIYDAFKAGKITGKELRENQEEILEKYRVEATAQLRLKQLALAAKVYIAKRKEYTAVKDGLIDRKKKIGTELSRLEKILSDLCEEVLHAKVTQPTLFDPQNRTNMPD